MEPRLVNPVDLSVVIPVRDEEPNIDELIGRLTKTLQSLVPAYEVVFVIDENTDRTPQLLQEHHRKDSRIKIVKLSRGFGQYVAVVAGLASAGGSAVVVMDGDLQDYPEDIKVLHDKMHAGFDIVYGIKEKKHDSWFRGLASKTFQRIWNWLADYRGDFNTSIFRILSRKVVDAMLRYHEADVSLSGIATLVGFRSTPVVVTSGSRKAGATKYSLASQINLAINFLLSYSTKPLRLFSISGLVMLAAGLVYLCVLCVLLLLNVPFTVWQYVVASIFLVSGLHIAVMGIIGEYVGKIYIQSKNRPLYIVDEKFGDLR
jgi:polyisoprenyl-phosphate glycosyltransferase